MKHLIKNRFLTVGAVVILASGLLGACEVFEECGTCEMVTIDADGNETRTTPLPYCGDQLAERKDSQPVTVGGITTYWECY
jgi:hypothetical protein